MTKPKLSIVIVNWNTQALLQKCLESLGDSVQRLVYSGQRFDQTPTTNHQTLDTEIIVVDNGSTDNSIDYLKQLEQNQPPTTNHQPPDTNHCTLRVIYNTDNLGFGKANNQGIKVAQGDYIMLLNSDTIVKPGSISKLVDYLDNHPETFVVGPKLLNSNGTSQANCGNFPNLTVSFIMLFLEKFVLAGKVRFSPSKTQTVDWLMGAAFMFRRGLYDKVGGLDEGIFMYMEEVEWFYRVHQKGYKVECFPEVSIIHLGRGSSKSGKKEPILNIYRGLIHFYKTHYSRASLILLLVMLKSKALLSFSLGLITQNRYLTETYGEAIKIN